MLDVSITIQCSKKPGTLSRVIREIKLFGLVYKSHSIRYEDEYCSITINASGELNCSREQLIELFEALPTVLRTQRISISRDGVEISDFRTIKSDAHIAEQEELSPAILLAAEKRMSEILGPVSEYLVEKAAQNSRNVGELYRNLAEELDDKEERKEFLSVVEKLGK